MESRVSAYGSVISPGVLHSVPLENSTIKYYTSVIYIYMNGKRDNFVLKIFSYDWKLGFISPELYDL